MDRKTIGRSARRKGATFDLRCRKLWSSSGFKCRKVSVGLEGPDYSAEKEGLLFSVEVTKNASRAPMAIYKNLEKASLGDGIPVAVVQRNYQKSVVLIYEEDFLRLIGDNNEAT